MSRSFAPRARSLKLIAALTAVAALLAFIGCSDDDKAPTAPGGGGTPTTTSFTGILSDGLSSGKLTVTVNTTTLAGHRPVRGLLGAGNAPVTATGVAKVGGVTTNMTGTYDPDTDSLYLAGGGWTIAGLLSTDGTESQIEGTVTGPGGTGFFICANLPNRTINIYTGKYWNQALTDSGTWDMATVADTVFIVAFSQGGLGVPITLEGMLSGTGNPRTLTATGGDVSTFEVDATGDLDTATGVVGGLWTYDSHDAAYGTDDNGDFSGALVP